MSRLGPSRRRLLRSGMLLGSPVWDVRPPMIMSTFADSFDFTGRTVHPFVTCAVGGLGRTERVHTDACPWGQISPGLTVQGEEVTEHRDEVATWPPEPTAQLTRPDN